MATKTTTTNPSDPFTGKVAACIDAHAAHVKAIATASTCADVMAHEAAANSASSILAKIGGGAKRIPTMIACAAIEANRRTAALHAQGIRMVNLDASTPAALSATLEALRHWMVAQGVACVTIMPQDVAAMGVDADTASQRMWDAAQDAITETRFEAKVVWKDAKEAGLLLKGEWKLFSLAEDLSEDEDDASDIFFCAGGKYATADDFIRAHQKDNSPEEWYIVEPAPMAPRGWDVAETDHD